MSSNETISDSQTSHVSSLSLGLSQDTVNQVLGAVGLNSATGDMVLKEFHTTLDDDVEEDEGEGEGALADGEEAGTSHGSSTLSISRAVFFANSQASSSDNSASQFLPSSPPPPHSTPSTSHTPTSSHSWTSPAYADNGFSPNLIHSSSPPPISQMHLSTSPLQHLPPSQPPHPQTSQFPLQSPIPQNVPFAGAHGFSLSLDSLIPSSKCPNLVFSTEMQRMYIKKDAVVPLMFLLTEPPPLAAVIRAMAIHKRPEMIGDNLHCCAKHVDEMNKKGILHPFHFIRSSMENSTFFGDPNIHRLSVTIPITSLQRGAEHQYTALYQFPCFTSDFQRAGQLVQLIFTLESDANVWGRATLDVRVCASPGRDKTVDERKVRQKRGVVSEEEPVRGAGRRGRKRAAREEIHQGTFPPKRVCGAPLERKTFTIETYTEIMPYIMGVVRLMEKVYMVPIGMGGASSHGNAGPPSLPRQDSFPSLGGWLEGLGLTQYLSLFHNQGVRETFQVLSLTDQELQAWGVGERNRKIILDSAVALQECPAHPTPSLPSSQLQLSQGSTATTTAGTQPFQFEVIQIEARKTLQ